MKQAMQLILFIAAIICVIGIFFCGYWASTYEGAHRVDWILGFLAAIPVLLAQIVTFVYVGRKLAQEPAADPPPAVMNRELTGTPWAHDSGHTKDQPGGAAAP